MKYLYGLYLLWRRRKIRYMRERIVFHDDFADSYAKLIQHAKSVPGQMVEDYAYHAAKARSMRRLLNDKYGEDQPITGLRIATTTRGEEHGTITRLRH